MSVSTISQQLTLRYALPHYPNCGGFTAEMRMDRDYAHAHYTTSRVDDNQEGFSAVELYRTRRSDGKNVRVARVVFWDACGDFFFETFNADIPVRLAEDLISEARTTIKIR